MAHENKILHVSLFVGLIGMLAGGGADGAVRIGNNTKNDMYRQIVAANAAAYNNQIATTSATDAELPVRVANDDLAKQITNGTANISSGQLDACSRIYPNGVFAWDRPTAGIGAGGASTCAAVVELRGYQMGPGGSDVVLARANIAAGSSVKCNISDFPENSYTIDAQNVTFPSDNEPTMTDVVRVMDREQKQNAGLKIAAATLVGAIGGNIVGKNDIGKDGIIGTDKGKMQGTLIGALGGAAIGAGGSYLGKVGGDMVLSTGINAAAGGVVGNIMASGDSVLRIEDCKKSDGTGSGKCLWGYVVDGSRMTTDADGKLCDTTGKCIKAFFDLSDKMTIIVCNEKGDDCRPDNLVSITIVGNKDVNSLKDAEIDGLKGDTNNTHMMVQNPNGTFSVKQGLDSTNSHIYVPVVSGVRPTQRKAALVWNVQDKFFGMKRSDWAQWKSKNSAVAEIYLRDTRGNATDPVSDMYTLDNFEPMYVDASDGGIVDLNNKARLKGTLIGSGVGGAAGAFVAYQGAQSDIDERWVSAVREYKDSLQKFYCATGSRFLSYYNDVVVIPNINE